MRRGERRGHLHVAAGKAEVIGPQGVLAPPVDGTVENIFELAHEDVLVHLPLDEGVAYRFALTDRVLIVRRIGVDPGKFVLHRQSLIVLASPAGYDVLRVPSRAHRYAIGRQDLPTELL
ncbi:hypothetical protein D3C76_1331040 [compost metagenome]